MTQSLADRFFGGAMSPEVRDDPYPCYDRFRGPEPLLRAAEGEIALKALLHRFAGIELAGPPTRLPTFTVRGPATLSTERQASK